MANKIIDSSDPGLVAKETTIKLSDEKLRGMLSRTYERAQKDTTSPKFYKFYSVFLSIAGTLFLSLLTSSFEPLGNISAEIVTKFAYALCVASAILGFVLMGISVSRKTKNDTNERDAAVNQIFNQYFSED